MSSTVDMVGDMLVRPGAAVAGGEGPGALTVLRRFPFLSSMRRMAVVTGALDGSFAHHGPVYAFVKV